MNPIQDYAESLANKTVKAEIFNNTGLEVCPAEGTRPIKDFAASLSDWYRHVDHIEIINVICKTWSDGQHNELQGVINLKVYYKVIQGEAVVSATQVLSVDESNKISFLNSFWDLERFQTLANEHPELKQLFKKGK
jgi:hypothetical protein